jgi:hypothetical protein
VLEYVGVRPGRLVQHGGPGRDPLRQHDEYGPTNLNDQRMVYQVRDNPPPSSQLLTGNYAEPLECLVATHRHHG